MSLAKLHPLKLHLSDGGPDLKRQLSRVLMLRVDECVGQSANLFDVLAHEIIVHSDDVVESLHQEGEDILIINVCRLKEFAHNELPLLGCREVFVSNWGGTGECFDGNLRKLNLVRNHIRKYCKED